MNRHQHDLLALCALEGVTGKQWQVIARQASSPGGLTALLDGHVRGSSPIAKKLERHLAAALPRLDEAREHVAAAHESATAVGAQLVTVLEATYPFNLARVRNRPPFLYRRSADADPPDDVRAVAVVGTRKPTDAGRQRASKLARELADAGVVVTSGMADGIDTVAHEAALAAGARTVAVMGTGILRCYPARNGPLMERIIAHGVVWSQFWPDQPPGRHTFPMRNVVTSGLSQATVVVEAGDTSGARLQGRLAADQGRDVFLLASLVADRPWAAEMVRAGRALELTSTDDVLDRLRTPAELRAAQPPEQLSLE